MEVKIKNKLPRTRSIPTPANTSISVGPLLSVNFFYNDNYEDFFKGLEAYDFDVETVKDESSNYSKELAEEKIEEVADSHEDIHEDIHEDSHEDTNSDLNSKLEQLDEGTLKEILSNLGVRTNATRKDTLISKILEAGDEESINDLL